MWHLGIKKDATLILLVGVFVVFALTVFLVTLSAKNLPIDSSAQYNPAAIDLMDM